MPSTLRRLIVSEYRSTTARATRTAALCACAKVMLTELFPISIRRSESIQVCLKHIGPRRRTTAQRRFESALADFARSSLINPRLSKPITTRRLLLAMETCGAIVI